MKIYCASRNGLDGSAAVYSLLRYAFCIEYGDRDLPRIDKTPNGKPYFRDRCDIHFSLSHSRTHVLCALSNEPVGADIESPRQLNERVIRFFCSPEELIMFDPLDLWVLKESYIKLVGGTMAMLKELRFSREGDTILAPDNAVKSGLYSIDGCRAAICSIGKPPPASIESVNWTSSGLGTNIFVT